MLAYSGGGKNKGRKKGLKRNHEFKVTRRGFWERTPTVPVQSTGGDKTPVKMKRKKLRLKMLHAPEERESESFRSCLQGI